MFIISSFLLIYKPNYRRGPRVRLVWLAQPHSKAFQTPTYHFQRDASQLAKLDLAPRQSQTPLLIEIEIEIEIESLAHL
jgi:hypothetical protein